MTITELPATNAVPTTRTITTTAPLTGGGNLSADRTFAINAASTAASGVVQLSNSYVGNSQTVAVTEKALSDGLATATTPKYITISIGDGVNLITAAQKNYSAPISFAGTISEWRLAETSDPPVAGSIVFDIFKSTTAAYPPTVSIAGTEKPTLVTQTTNSDLALTTWTTAVSIGDCFGFNIDSVSLCKRVMLIIKVI